jgi:NAD(P)-dependent dehydrogenase (short-subunit alcohol dehydrogenase family)
VRAQFDTNVFGMLAMCRAALPSMRDQRWGKIVNMSSMGGEFVFPGGGVYHATKYAIEALSDALRYEVEGFGVDVIVIQPGLIKTDFSARTVAEIHAVAADAGPYAGFNAAVGDASKSAYEKGFVSRLGGPPDAVAESHRQGALRRPSEDALQGHPSGAADDDAALRRGGPGLGPDLPLLVPRPGVD